MRVRFETELLIRLLDVGCGPCFCAWPCEAVGVDPSIELLKFAAKNAPVRSFDVFAVFTASRI